MSVFLFPILAVLAGAFFLIRNIRLLLNPEKMDHYLRTSPKARRWVEKYGIEQTTALSKKYFFPLGCLVAGFLLCVGLWSLAAILLTLV